MKTLKLKGVKVLSKTTQKLILAGRIKLCEEDCVDMSLAECAERCWQV